MAVNLIDIVDRVTSVPGKIARKADQVNQDFIDYARKIQDQLDQAGNVAEENLRQNKIESLGREAATWLSKPGNLKTAGIIAGAVVLGIALISRRF